MSRQPCTIRYNTTSWQSTIQYNISGPSANCLNHESCNGCATHHCPHHIHHPFNRIFVLFILWPFSPKEVSPPHPSRETTKEDPFIIIMVRQLAQFRRMQRQGGRAPTAKHSASNRSITHPTTDHLCPAHLSGIIIILCNFPMWIFKALSDLETLSHWSQLLIQQITFVNHHHPTKHVYGQLSLSVNYHIIIITVFT